AYFCHRRDTILRSDGLYAGAWPQTRPGQSRRGPRPREFGERTWLIGKTLQTTATKGESATSAIGRRRIWSGRGGISTRPGTPLAGPGAISTGREAAATAVPAIAAESGRTGRTRAAISNAEAVISTSRIGGS